MTPRPRMILLATALVGLAACQEPENPACTGEIVLYFSGLPEGDIGLLSMGGVDFEVLSGEVAGYRGEGAATLLLMNARLALTLPCAAAEVELVIEDGQANLGVEGYATLDASTDPVLDERSWSATGLEPELDPFQRWTLQAPVGTRLRQVVLSTEGQSGVSVLVKSIVFR